MKVELLATDTYRVTRGWFRKRVAIVVVGSESYRVRNPDDDVWQTTTLRFQSGDEVDGEVAHAIWRFVAAHAARALRERNWKPLVGLPKMVARVAETR